jgi:hypothetical protein
MACSETALPLPTQHNGRIIHASLKGPYSLYVEELCTQRLCQTFSTETGALCCHISDNRLAVLIPLLANVLQQIFRVQ